MKESITRLENALEQMSVSVNSQTEADLSHKPAPNKWSKKEILGHLIDSAVNNLQRFTEIQFQEKPYKIRSYYQDELVEANQYNHADSSEILSFWVAINRRIVILMKLQTETTLNYEIEFGSGKISDLRFLMEDYVVHLEHHLRQIVD